MAKYVCTICGYVHEGDEMACHQKDETEGPVWEMYPADHESGGRMQTVS